MKIPAFGGQGPSRWPLVALAAVLAVVVAVTAVRAIVKDDKAAQTPGQPAPARPSLTVTVATPQPVEWPQILAATGSIAAWQEAVIGPELSNYRLTEVLVNVGDAVRKGQLLARISSESVAAELAQARAAAAESEALLAEAKANADRARRLEPKGVMSAQQVNQYLTAEQAAAARLDAARARIEENELRLARTRVLAPDAGIVSARTATVGSLAQPGQELFRLIRGGRLEWRAEVPAAELGKLKPGVAATLTTPDGIRVQGRVRMVAPTVDPQTHNGLVYVDLPVAETGSAVRAGMFARGAFELGSAPALTLPQSAVLLREGFAYVFRLEAGDRVAQTKVTVGRRAGERIEITGGLEPGARVVASGAGFLADGDIVRVVGAVEEPKAAQR